MWLLDDSTDEFNFLKFVPVSSDGAFDVVHGDGAFTIQVWVWQEERGSRSVGWYGGEGGFTTDREQATVIVVDGADVTDIEMRLPAGIRGTVLDSEGEPAIAMGLWLWGGSTENSGWGVSDAGGTFYIIHQDGTFTLRVHIRKDDGWHHIGWYGGETGFTIDREQAIVIELDGADVTGIEIRLPPNPADLPAADSAPPGSVGR